MAKGNVKILRNPHGVSTTEVFLTEAAATAIYAGEPVKLKAAGSEYVIPLADADPVLGTDTSFVGIAASDSNHTSGADGEIEVYLLQPGVVYACKAKSATAFDTAAEIKALKNTKVLFDLTSSTYTVDTGASADTENGLIIIGGDADTSTVYFMIDQGVALGSDATVTA